ncbi:Zinc finger, GRF-type [Sesbania bispinosa]|nr:Zinc finger, GRF-type [Sesbania bispinosa]
MRRGISSLQKKVASSRTSSFLFHSRHSSCDCCEELILMTSKMVTNPGKKFWRCPNWNKNMSCEFFRWAEEECIDRASCLEDLKDFKVENTQLKKKVAKLQKKVG